MIKGLLFRLLILGSQVCKYTVISIVIEVAKFSKNKAISKEQFKKLQ